MSLPLILVESMQRALDNGTFFSSDSLFGHFLPRPEFPRTQRTDSNRWSEFLPHSPRIELDPLSSYLRKGVDDERDSKKAEKIWTTSNSYSISQKGQQVCTTPQNMDGASEWNSSSTEADCPSNRSCPSPSLVGFKKQKKIVLTAEQAKEASYLFITKRFEFDPTH